MCNVHQSRTLLTLLMPIMLVFFCDVHAGRLPLDCRPRDLEDMFYKYGRIIRCDVKVGFGFVEYEDRRDAEDAIRDLVCPHTRDLV